MPLFHTAQLNGFGTPAVLMGATQYLLRGFDPDALLDPHRDASASTGCSRCR